MGRILGRYVWSLALVGCVASGAGAGELSLEEQVQALIQQNRVQAQMIKDLQQRMAGLDSSSQPETQQVTDGSSAHLATLAERLEWGVLVEVQGSDVDDFNGDDTSDVTLATVEIALSGRVSKWSEANLVLLYEEGEEDDHLIVDEGILTIGNMEEFPLYLSAGKMYMPFGSFESNMISDPLTLEIAEIGESGLLLGFESHGFYGSLYGFNGDIDEVSASNDDLDNFGVSGGYVIEKDGFTTDLGLNYINNIADTDGIGDFLDEHGVAEIEEYVGGLAAYAVVGIGPFSMVAEYITALDDFSSTEVEYQNSGAQPEAYNFEAAYSMGIWQRLTTLAVGYQGTDEAVAFGLPESRYLGTLSMEVLPYTALGLEYCHAEDYSLADGGTGKNADSLTLQLALEL